MDKETLQQLNYASLFLSMWIREGAGVWSFTYTDPVKTDVKIDGRCVDTKELSDYAIYAKRSGNYAEAIGAYIQTMAACKKETGKIPVAHARGLFKVLVCVNYFNLAFNLVSTVYADMQQSKNVDPQEMMLFQQYFSQLASLSMSVVDNNDFTQVVAFAANYSGTTNYTLQRTPSDIKEDMKPIREGIRRAYGK